MARDLSVTLPQDAHLSGPFAELARHEPSALIASATALPAETSWQQREAAIFASQASMEVVISRVFALPGQPPPPEAAKLEALLMPLLQGSLAPPDFHGTTTAAVALLLRARCRLVGACAAWLSGTMGSAVLGSALAGVLPCLSHPASTTAEAALFTFTQLSLRCDLEIARSDELVRAALATLTQSTPALGVEQRAQLIESVTRLAVAAPAERRLGYIEQLLAPLIQAVSGAAAAIERAPHAAAGSDTLALAASLAESLEGAAAALKALRGIARAVGPDAVAALFAVLWPAWGQAAAVARAAPTVLLPPLSRLGRAGLAAAGTAGHAALQPMATALAGAFAASAPHGAPLVDVADAIFEIFCEMPGLEGPFTSLLDQLVSTSAPTLQGLIQSLSAEAEPLALASALLSHADKISRLLVPALAAATSLPLLVSLATALVGGCRQPDATMHALSFLGGAMSGARLARSGLFGLGSDEAAAAVRSQLQAALGGAAGAAIVRACVSGLHDTIPVALVPSVADVLGPALGMASWRTAADGGFASWAHAALAALPTADGVPDARTRQVLHTVLCTMPDAYADAGGVRLDHLMQLREAIGEFARVCRRLASASTFDLAAYDWK